MPDRPCPVHAACTCHPQPAAPTRPPTELERAIGKALVTATRELTVYVFGGDQGRRQVEHLWNQREAAARARREAPRG